MTYNDEELIQITESLKQEWLDKACKWLENNYPYYFEHTSVESELTFVEEFRKAMEE